MLFNLSWSFMKLFVDTSERRTEVEPKFSGTAPEHYAACIQKANDCLDNSLPGLKKATDAFIENMQKHPGTAEIVKYTFAQASVLSAGSDEELRDSMASFLVRTKNSAHAASVGALIQALAKGTTLFTSVLTPATEATFPSSSLTAAIGS
jgi:hypothetical protein